MTGVDNTVEVSIPVEADAAAALSDARARIDMLPWIEAQEAAVVRSGFDADDWIAQTWAYDRHNVGDTMVDGHPALGGDRLRALGTVKAKALLTTGTLDLYNPVEGAIEAARAIPAGRYVTIPSVQGHVAASHGFRAQDLEFTNGTVRGFMREVTGDWRTVQWRLAGPKTGACRAAGTGTISHMVGGGAPTVLAALSGLAAGSAAGAPIIAGSGASTWLGVAAGGSDGVAGWNPKAAGASATSGSASDVDPGRGPGTPACDAWG